MVTNISNVTPLTELSGADLTAPTTVVEYADADGTPWR